MILTQHRSLGELLGMRMATVNAPGTGAKGASTEAKQGPCLDASCKVFEREYFHICTIKYRLITKLMTEVVSKLQNEFIKTN